MRSSFLADPEFQRLRGLAKSDLHFLAAVGLWSIANAQAWRDDNDDAADILACYPGFPKGADYLRDSDLNREGERLAGFAKWTEAVRQEREIWARRAAMNANPKLTQAVRDRDGDCCRYCGQLVNWQDRRSPAGGTYDHILPIDQGGDEFPENLVVACRQCNGHKAARTPEQAGMTLRPTRSGIYPVFAGSNLNHPVSTKVGVGDGVVVENVCPKPPQAGASDKSEERRGNKPTGRPGIE